MATIQELKAAVDAAQVASDAAQSALTSAQLNRNAAASAYGAALNTYNAAVAAGVQAGTVGEISSVTALLLAERNAGIQAAASFIQANPTATQAQAITAWTTAALAATTLPALLQDPTQLFGIYALNLHNTGAIPDTTWASFAAWVVATPLATILAD
jgi:hypothetical protein